MRNQSRDWEKVLKVILSVENREQAQTAKNLIKNYRKMYGEDSNYKMLELELKSVKRRL